MEQICDLLKVSRIVLFVRALRAKNTTLQQSPLCHVLSDPSFTVYISFTTCWPVEVCFVEASGEIHGKLSSAKPVRHYLVSLLPVKMRRLAAKSLWPPPHGKWSAKRPVACNQTDLAGVAVLILGERPGYGQRIAKMAATL